MLRHPRQERAQKVLPELIEQLRACRSPADGYELQEALFAELLEVEEARNALSRAAKRMKDRKSPQPGAPEPQSGLDPGQPETWQLEHDVCERVARQFRRVGDALAWRVFGFQRKYLIALSQNAQPGVMAGKEGLAAERDCVRQAWENGRFALLHDLTNCLRIGDVTVFGNDDSHEIIEVKSDPARRSPAQRRRIRAAQAALQGSGPLPGSDRRARLYDLDVPFRTHLDLLGYGLQRAVRDGIFGASLPGARALVAADIYGCSAQGWTDDEYQQRLGRQHAAALRRAGMGRDRTWNMSAASLDSVARDPLRVPFAAYPLHPDTWARLIGDLAFFAVETNGPALEECLAAAGIDAGVGAPALRRAFARGRGGHEDGHHDQACAVRQDTRLLARGKQPRSRPAPSRRRTRTSGSSDAGLLVLADDDETSAVHSLPALLTPSRAAISGATGASPATGRPCRRSGFGAATPLIAAHHSSRKSTAPG